MRIRAARKSDTPQILGLLYELGRPRPKTGQGALFARRVLRYLSDKDKKILVAEHGGELVGAVSVIITPKLNRGPELYIPDLIVSSGRRRAGVGESLIRECVREAKRKKCYRIRLESGHKRRAAHKFYRKIGFEQPAKTYVLRL